MQIIFACMLTALVVVNFHWRGSETQVGMFFLREYYFTPSEDNKNILDINGDKLKTKTPANGFFRGLNRELNPEEKHTEQAMRSVIDKSVKQHVDGVVKYTTRAYRKGEYRPANKEC